MKKFLHIKANDVAENDFGNIIAKDLLNSNSHSISIAEIDLKGKQKFGLDKKSDIYYCIIKGHGKFFFDKKVINVKQGDIVYISRNTKYKDQGKLTFLAISSPRFDAKNHVYFH